MEAPSASIVRISELNKFDDTDNTGEVRQICARLRELKLEGVTLRQKVTDLDTALADSDPRTIRQYTTSYADVIEKISATKNAVEGHMQKIEEIDQNIQRLKKKLASVSASDLRVGQLRATILRDAEEVFARAVERYKVALRSRVEASASKLFLSMTTETQDYKGLCINESYGLSIQHRDGRPEEARSAGAEHVVALALMGALQQNAPLRGPIVMDSPFGRLDEGHTTNVVRTLPEMTSQIILLVYQSELGKDQARELLRGHLVREYELVRVSARRTNVCEVK